MTMAMAEAIYFDNAATTALHPEARAAMLPYFDSAWGNPSSLHRMGRVAARALAASREELAGALACKPDELYFTSGGTESDNWALVATMEAALKQGRRHVVVSAVEHHAILNTCSYLETRGFEVTRVAVDGWGRVELQVLEAAVQGNTALVSVMLANNEVGTLQPLKHIAQVAHERGALVHTDAVQAFGHIPIDVQALGVDMLSLSGHKFGAPKGVGALFCSKGAAERFGMGSFMHGGGQERGMRAGTENVPGVVGMAAAAHACMRDMQENITQLLSLREHMEQRVLAEIPSVRLNSYAPTRLPGIVNLGIAGIDSAAMLEMLDAQGICASGGSACSSVEAEPSHVLQAMGQDAEQASSALRFSFSPSNTLEEVDTCVEALKQNTTQLRHLGL